MEHFIALTPKTILLLPLLGAIFIAVFGPYFHRAGAALIGNLSIFLSFILSAILAIYLWRLPEQQQIWNTPHPAVWAHIPPLTITFRLLVDPLALIWMLIITGVGFLIHLYSVSYMADEKNYRTFFAYMNLFVFTMLLLVMADNFLWLLVGWAGVGLASYLLIGFHYQRRSAVLAARKALIMNVIGDVGIMIAIFLMYAHVGSVSYDVVFGNIFAFGTPALTAIGLWLLLGAVAKSAQLPLQTWLPDAMEGPTPVSALIHAATMVTAGVYLVARAHPIYDHAPAAAAIVAVVGAATALFAASIGCVQYDIKRVLAYSTMSQIGYMILGVGVGAYAAGAFHFLTHAYFKALLFMAAGIVIHNLAGEQDIRKMGGLARRMPFAFWTFAIGTLAIAGIPPLAGFFSKDAVLDQVLRLNHPLLYCVATAAALLTAFYMFRLLFLTFFTGDYRGEHEPHVSRSLTMVIPTAILAALSVIGGWIVLPGRDLLSPALAATFSNAIYSQSLAQFNTGLSFGTLLLGLAGILGAYTLYENDPQRREVRRAWLQRNFALSRDILLNAYYFDWLYHWVFERPTYALAYALARVVDPDAIAGVPRALADAAVRLGDVARGWESGYLRRYGLTFVVGVALLLIFYLYLTHLASAHVR